MGSEVSVVRSPVRSVVRSPVRGVFGGSASLADEATSYLNGVTPYHWFDYVQNRALYAGADVGNVTQATGYSFTRASQGYYTNSDGTLTLFGYNLLTWSEQFDNAAWAKVDTTVTANAIAAPDGTMTADLLTEGTAGTAATTLTSAVTVAVASPVAHSVFVKRGNSDWLFLQLAGSGTERVRGWFNLGTGAVGSTSVAGSATLGSISIQALANDWYRCVLVGTLNGVGTTCNVLSTIVSADGGTTRVNNATRYIWGAQLDQGAQATAYVPTTTAAVSALRRGDRGVLIEGARTNLLIQSQDFATTWTCVNIDAFGSGSVVNAIAAPDGTVTADFLRPSTSSGTHLVSQATTNTAASYTYSLFVKSGGYSRIGFRENTTSGAYITFDLPSLATLASSSATGTVVALANGWYRVTFTFTAAAVLQIVGVYVLDSAYTTQAPHSYNWSADGTSGIYLWGAQLEAASFPSTYIPTTTASATRAADVLAYTAGVTYPMRLWSEFERAVDTGAGEIIAQLDAGSDANRLGIYVTSIDRPQAFVASSGATQADISIASTIAINTTAKIAARCASNSVNMAYNGTAGTEDTTVTVPSSPTLLRVGAGPASAFPSFGYIRRIAAVQGGGVDADLIAMTS